MSSHDSNARLVDLIRAGLSRADQLGRARVPLKLYPAEGSAKVEEFYYRDGQLVYVRDEPTGSEQAREQYFFSAGQLVAAVEADGKLAALDDAEKAKGAKLVAESQAFLKLAAP